MKIDEIILREIEMRLRAPFETSFGTVRGRRIALMEVRCDGVSGWGEVTAAEGPFYNSETTDTAWTVLCKFIAPLVLGQNIRAASEVMRLLEPVRGHEMAKAALETALWDVEARQRGLPLWKLLGGTRPERSEEHTSELQSRLHLVCRLLLENKKLAPAFQPPSVQERYQAARSFVCDC